MYQLRKKYGWLGLLLLVIYLALVIYFVLFSDRLGRADGFATYHYNLHPFEEIRRFINYRQYISTGTFLLNIFGNLLVCFPFGFFVVALRRKKTGAIRVILYTFLFSLCIESLQLVLKVGVFDVDDLIMNTIGGYLGWVVAMLFTCVWRVYVRMQMRKRGNNV